MKDTQEKREPHAYIKGEQLFLNTDKEIREKINGLEYSARKLLMQTDDLHIEDFYFMAVIDKSIKLIDPFLFAYKTRNIDVLAALTRMQIDCVIRTYATTLVENSTDFCKEVLFNHTEIHKLKDRINHKLDDKYMCEKLEEYLGLPIYDLYKFTCEFIHFSSTSFDRIAKAEEDNHISLFISKKNRPEDEKEYKRLSRELANQFYYLGYLLQNKLIQAWYDQLEYEKSLQKNKDHGD